jgi:hypothetical protein
MSAMQAASKNMIRHVKSLSEWWPTVMGLRVWHSLKIRPSINVLDLTGVAHVSGQGRGYRGLRSRMTALCDRTDF